ncbi:MAG: restriction endonuclease subunit S [bacterium]
MRRILIRIRPASHIDPAFLSHFFDTPNYWGQISLRAQGAGQPGVNGTKLKQLKIPLPPLAEQKRIAAILDQADAVRRYRRKAIDTIADLTPSIFSSMFGSGHDIERYKVGALGAHAEVVSGVTKGRRFNGQPTVMLPYLRVANVQDGRLELDEIKAVEALPGDLDKLRLEPGDVLLTEGGDHDKLGRGALWEGQIDNCIHQNHIFRVRVDRKRLTPVFFAKYLRTPFAKAYFLRCAKKTTNLATINMRQLRALPVPLPPLGEQQRFDEEATVASSLLASSERALKETNDLFASLVQRAFRGEL